MFNIEKEISENQLERNKNNINLINKDSNINQKNHIIDKKKKINNPFIYEKKIKEPFNKDNEFLDEIDFKNIYLSTNDKENINNNFLNNDINNKEKLKEKEINNIKLISKNEADNNSIEKIKNDILLYKDNNIKEKRNRSAIKEKSFINTIEIEIENKKLSLENEQLKNNYNSLRNELLKEKENNLKLTISYEKILLDNSLLTEKINKLKKKIVKLKNLNEIYINNYNEIKKKLEYKNKSIDIKLEKLTQNFNIITTKFLDSSIYKINFDSIKNKCSNSSNKIKNEENIKKSYNIIPENKEINNLKTIENGNISISKKMEENDKINGLFDSSISYRSFLEKLNESNNL